MSFEYNLICAMREYDLHINSINLETGKYHRFRSLGTCKNKCCEYRIFENQLGAHFKCFRRGIDRFWFDGDRDRMTVTQQKTMAEERRRVEQERTRSRSNAAKKCQRFWKKISAMKSAATHPYTLRKNIYPHNAIIIRGMCVLAVRDIDYEIQSLQFIKKNGFKQFKAGGSVSGNMIWLCDELPENYSGVIRLCEGWSTGCTIKSITKSPVICALNAYNLVKVANEIRTKYIKAHVKICADNDQWGKENVGLNCAKQASGNTGYSIHYPSFENLEVGSKPTDFNDLYAIGGYEATKKQLILMRKEK